MLWGSKNNLRNLKTVTCVPFLDKIVWKTCDAPNEKQGALNTTAAFRAFAGANYNSVSQLIKDLCSKEEELQKARKDLDATEACHLIDIKFLKEENQDKQTQWEDKFESVNHQLEKLEVAKKQQDDHNYTLEEN